MAERRTEHLRAGLRVVSSDGQRLGTVVDAWTDAGLGEAWGAIGARLIAGVDTADPVLFAYSEAMPGEGEGYLLVRNGAEYLYVPCTYVATVRRGSAVLSLTADAVPAMQWDVRPDFLADTRLPDSGAGPFQA